VNERRVRALIAEDEAPARESLRAYLGAAPWVEVVAEAVDGRSALALAEEHRPNLLFLDVRLPELSGLEVARQLRHPAEIIFTTAYDRFAVAAFELGALDYLVKPFGQERLAAALGRLRARMDQSPAPSTAGERARSSLSNEPLTRLFARHGDRIVPVPVEGIRRIQAQGDYAEVHAAEGVYLLHVTLSELAARLDPAKFRQVHRSHIVNLDAVEHLQPYDDRRLAIRLRDGTTVVASRAASEELRRLAR
jgi:two-component system LytT family response regulator